MIPSYETSQRQLSYPWWYLGTVQDFLHCMGVCEVHFNCVCVSICFPSIIVSLQGCFCFIKAQPTENWESQSVNLASFCHWLNSKYFVYSTQWKELTFSEAKTYAKWTKPMARTDLLLGHGVLTEDYPPPTLRPLDPATSLCTQTFHLKGLSWGLLSDGKAFNFSLWINCSLADHWGSMDKVSLRAIS